MQTTSKHRSIWLALAVVAVVILAILHGIRAVGTLLLAFKAYQVPMGLMGSPWVGFANFDRLFSSMPFIPLLRNTLLGGAATALLTALIAVPVILGASSVRRPWSYIIVGAMFLPYLVPQPALAYGGIQLVGSQSLIGPAAVWISAFYQALLLAPFVVLGGVFLAQYRKFTAGRLLALALLASLGAGWYAGVCAGEFPATFFTNPLNYEWTDVLQRYSFRMSILNMETGMGAAAHILSGLLGKLGLLIFAVPVFALLPARAQAAEHKAPAQLWPLALPGIVLCTAALLLSFFPIQAAQVAAPIGLGNILSTMLTLLSPLPGVLLGAALAGLFAGKSSTNKIIAAGMIVLLSAVGTISMSAYLIRRSMGLINTIMPVFDYSYSVLLSALAVGLFGKLGQPKASRTVMLCCALVLLLFLAISGDPGLSIAYTSDQQLMTIPALQRSVAMNASGISPLQVAPAFSIVLLAVLAGAVALMIGATAEQADSSIADQQEA